MNEVAGIGAGIAVPAGTEVIVQGEMMELVATAKLPTIIDRATEALLTKAKVLTIVSDEGYVAAGQFGVAAKAERDRLEEERVEMKAPFLRDGKRVDDHYRMALKNLDDAVAAIKKAMGGYNEKKRIAAAAEQKRLDDQRAAAAAEAKKREDEALAKVREEEQARLRTAEAKAAEERQRREAAEAESRKAEEEKQAALARAAGDRAAAEAADKRAQQAEAEAKTANENAAAEREKAIAAKRAELKAQRETAQAVATANTANDASTELARATPGTARVAGANDRITVKWKFRNVVGDRIPARYLCLNETLLQADIDRMKDSAQGILGDWLEVFSEEALALKKGSKT